MSRSAVFLALAITAFSLCVAVIVFEIWPEIDLWATDLFANDKGRFPVRRDPTLSTIRYALWNTNSAVFALCFVMALVQALFRTHARIGTRIWAFISLNFILGPGLLVNLGLKTYLGRARPFEIEEFGGEAKFSQALRDSDQCLSNCSFVSGEASGLFTTAFALTLTFIAALDGFAQRLAACTAIWLIALLGAGLRIAVGAHFLSDVVFAFLFAALISFSLYLAFSLERDIKGATPANALRDMQDLFRGLARYLHRKVRRIR